MKIWPNISENISEDLAKHFWKAVHHGEIAWLFRFSGPGLVTVISKFLFSRFLRSRTFAFVKIPFWRLNILYIESMLPFHQPPATSCEQKESHQISSTSHILISQDCLLTIVSTQVPTQLEYQEPRVLCLRVLWWFSLN